MNNELTPAQLAACVNDARIYVAQEARLVAERYRNYGESEMTRKLRQALYQLACTEARRDGMPTPEQPTDLF